MSFTERETDILNRLRENVAGFPFTVSSDELDIAVQAIKRERGNAEEEARRTVRAWVANQFDWDFAMDGGFMPKKGQPGYSQKFWQDSGDPFGRVYKMFENIVLNLKERGWTMQQIDRLAMSPHTCKALEKQEMEYRINEAILGK